MNLKVGSNRALKRVVAGGEHFEYHWVTSARLRSFAHPAVLNASPFKEGILRYNQLTRSLLIWDKNKPFFTPRLKTNAAKFPKEQRQTWSTNILYIFESVENLKTNGVFSLGEKPLRKCDTKKSFSFADTCKILLIVQWTFMRIYCEWKFLIITPWNCYRKLFKMFQFILYLLLKSISKLQFFKYVV